MDWPWSILDDSFSRRHVPTPTVKIHTVDDIVYATQIGYVKPIGSEFLLTFILDDILDLDTVVAVEVAGEMVYFL